MMTSFSAPARGRKYEFALARKPATGFDHLGASRGYYRQAGGRRRPPLGRKTKLEENVT